MLIILGKTELRIIRNVDFYNFLVIIFQNMQKEYYLFIFYFSIIIIYQYIEYNIKKS